MWNTDASNGAGGGYFQDSTTPGGSGTPEKKVFKAQNVVPFTISQVVNCKDGALKIGKTDVHMVTVVGRLVSKQIKSTSESFMIEDDTGRIEAVVFISTDDGTLNSPDYPLNEYYRVFGSLTSHANQNRLMMYKMMPIASLDEMVSHLLEVIYAPKHVAEIESQENTVQPVSDPMAPFGGQGATNQGQLFDPNASRSAAVVSSLSHQQQSVYKIISQNAGTQGLDKNSIPPMLNNRITVKELDVILEFLASEGHIYTTVDDSTYRATDL